MSNKKPVALIIMDGLALAPEAEYNAVAMANTPNLDHYFASYPWAKLATSGLDVGLLEGQMGDSNVGHLNIGAGRVVVQTLARIMQSIKTRTIFENPVLTEAVLRAKTREMPLHIMGLLSDGGVHSHIEQVYSLLELIANKGPVRTYIHAFLDGRDVPPQSARTYINQLEDKLSQYPFAKIATVAGRYYAMDRDKRWNRTEKAVDAIVRGKGAMVPSALAAVEGAYQQDITDEFVWPSVVVGDDGLPVATIDPGEAVIFINFRADRARQISKSLQEEEVFIIGMAEYDEDLKLPTAFPPNNLGETLGEVVSKAGLRQLRAAETEKYAHVTFFLNGGREDPYSGEERILVPSPSVATYDLKPEMSAYPLTEKVIARLSQEQPPALLVINYANGDMVGHTGSLQATIKAVEAVDECVGKIVDAIGALGGSCLITADHGNAEQMRNPTKGGPHTAHTKNLVPCIIIAENVSQVLPLGKLADIAPTVLQLLELTPPQVMTGSSLIME